MKKLMHLILTVYLIGIMAISSFASELYVYDERGLLEAEELVNLNAKAEAVSEKDTGDGTGNRCSDAKDSKVRA